MISHLHLAPDAAPIWKCIADSNGRVAVQEHWPEMLIDGEDAYLVEWAYLTQQQKLFLVEHVTDQCNIPVTEAETRCRFGLPIGRSQGIAIEVCGDLFSLDQTIYAPENPTPWGEFDPDEVV